MEVRTCRLYVLTVLFLLLAGPGAACAGDPPDAVRDCADCPEMIHLSGGTFRMGDQNSDGASEEQPVHEVKVPAFSIGKYEVTFEEWDACVKQGACDRDILDMGWGRGRQPLMNVHWKDAQAYVRWLSAKTGKHYRLPSEAEWEYAARGGTNTRYPWGQDMEAGAAICWAECGPEADQTAPVGSARPNPFALYDMLGNVGEWVQDCWNDSYAGAPVDGSAREDGDCERHMVRGGWWQGTPFELRVALRAPVPTTVRSDRVGFRVARSD